MKIKQFPSIIKLNSDFRLDTRASEKLTSKGWRHLSGLQNNRYSMVKPARQDCCFKRFAEMNTTIRFALFASVYDGITIEKFFWGKGENCDKSFATREGFEV
jgi:hypothetical protein